jgi:hypothetical protein
MSVTATASGTNARAVTAPCAQIDHQPVEGHIHRRGAQVEQERAKGGDEEEAQERAIQRRIVRCIGNGSRHQ